MPSHRLLSSSSASSSSESSSSHSSAEESKLSVPKLFLLILGVGFVISTVSDLSRAKKLQQYHGIRQLYQSTPSEFRKSTKYRAFHKQLLNNFNTSPNKVFSEFTTTTGTLSGISGVYFEGYNRVDFSTTSVTDSGRLHSLHSTETPVTEYEPGLTLPQLARALRATYPATRSRLALSQSLYATATDSFKRKFSSPQELDAILPESFGKKTASLGQPTISFAFPYLEVVLPYQTERKVVTLSLTYSNKLKQFRLDDLRVQRL